MHHSVCHAAHSGSYWADMSGLSLNTHSETFDDRRAYNDDEDRTYVNDRNRCSAKAVIFGAKESWVSGSGQSGSRFLLTLLAETSRMLLHSMVCRGHVYLVRFGFQTTVLLVS